MDFGRDQTIYSPEGMRQERILDFQTDPDKAHLTRPRSFAGNGASAPDVVLQGQVIALTWAAYDGHPATQSLVHFPPGTAVAYEP